MNPISNLIGKKFSELTASELFQVVAAYCEQNRYEYNYEFYFKNRDEVEKYFESNFDYLYILKSFFKYWTK